MKRLIKKANEQVTLYHGTCSQRLKDILSSGAILPGGVTGITSSGLEADEGNEAFQQSLNTNGIYLASENSAEEYANSAVYVDEVMPAFPLVFKLEVDSSNLLPDMDDLGSNFQFTDNEEKWKQSMDKLQQCIHNGAIELSQISGVRFSNSIDDVVPDENYEFQDYLEGEVAKHLGKWYSPNEIMTIIESLEKSIQ